MREPPLGQRLKTVAKYVREGAFFADIGTDHAYLPIYLILHGRAVHAVCSDINAGPLATAEENAAEYSVSDRMDFLLCDGASGLVGHHFTDVAICGMGGELIADIIDTPCLKREGVRLILQPMTKQATLRKSLAEGGFRIIAEEYSKDGGKYYLTIVCEYDGTPRDITLYDAELGYAPTRVKLNEAERGYFEAKRRALMKELEGKERAGIADDDRRGLLLRLTRMLDEEE